MTLNFPPLIVNTISHSLSLYLYIEQQIIFFLEVLPNQIFFLFYIIFKYY